MNATRTLVLGPMLRHVGATEATVWVETDGPCTVHVRDAAAPTFCVEGRHYAIVVVGGLEPGREHAYDVRLDGNRVWPLPDSPFPPSTIRPVAPARRLKVAFGSCRVSAPHRPPYTRRRASDTRGFGVDALRALALAAARSGAERPDVLLLLGDQIYADEASVSVRQRLESRKRELDAPEDALDDFGDYAVAYRDAWSDPAVRWLLSTVPTAMIFDDHEIEAEWKLSQGWLDDMRARSWYRRRITGGLMAYWIYQHLGNLSPAELRGSDLLRQVAQAADAGPLLREFAAGADQQAGHSRWSFCWDLGRTRLLVIDSRAGRELTPGRRRIVDAGECDWIRDRLSEDYDDLLLASSVPFLLTPGLHDFETWNEAVADGVWGRRAARVGELIRRAASLDHWAAFGRSFRAFAVLLEDLAAGRLRPAPRSIFLLSGDVHHGYLAEVAFRRDAGARSAVWQVVSSGLRKPLDPGEKLAVQFAHSAPAALLGRCLRAAARVPPPPIRWRLVHPPVYRNQVGMLALGHGGATFSVACTRASEWERPVLHEAFSYALAPRVRE